MIVDDLNVLFYNYYIMFFNFSFRFSISRLFFITVLVYSVVYTSFFLSKGNTNNLEFVIQFNKKTLLVSSCLLEAKKMSQEFMTFPDIFSFLPYLNNDRINLPVVTVHGKAKGNNFVCLIAL